MKAFQFDHAGLYAGTTEADESPLEPGVYLLPARCTLTPPPADAPASKWPRWNGSAWQMVNRPAPAPAAEAEDPVAKLQAFLAQNPDVAALLSNTAA
jgi:hypothetical protein